MGNIANPLEFERELVELEAELEVLKDEIAGGDRTLTEKHAKLEEKIGRLKKDIYGKLTPYQRVELSRHFDRPFTLDFVNHMMEDFVELHGDRLYRDDPAIVAGLARFGEFNVVVVGHQRGRSTSDRIKRNFGMPQPEGYRKALRFFWMAEKFGLPLITFIDTQGAYPGLEAEERGQAQAIARNLAALSELTVPVIAVVIGEGGSGGALALGVADRVLMLENACYSVITPEGCASILWHHDRNEAPQAHAAQAAEMLQLTAASLKEQGFVDEVVKEPEGGAHRNHKEAAELLSESLTRQLRGLEKLTVEELLQSRYDKFRKMGKVVAD